MDVNLLSIILVLIIPFIYWYFTRNFNYWTKRGIIGPKPLFGFGNLLLANFKPFPLLELEFSKKYGKLFGVFCGNHPILTISDPKLIKLILVKDFHLFSNRRKFNTKHEILDKSVLYARDEEWKRLRSIISPVFTSIKMKKVLPLLLECVKDFTQVLKSCAENQREINLKDMSGNFSMDVIAKCAFATKINAYKSTNNTFISNANNIFHPKLSKIVSAFLFPKFLLRILNIKTIFDENSNQFLFNTVRDLLNKRRSNNENHNDLLQLLIDASKDNDDITPDNLHERHTSNKKILSENEIIAQSWLFLLAGYETTSTAMTFCLYELALNPVVQEKLYNELQTAINSNNVFDYEILSKLPFLDAVISESLRLYPPFIRIERESKTNYKLGDTGITLFEGQLVHISIYAVHHSEEYFPNAQQFIPERFLPENRDNITPYSYLPFAIGPRNCIAMRFALMEMKVCVAHIINQFKLIQTQETDIPPKYMTKTHICVTDSLIISIEERK